MTDSPNYDELRKNPFWQVQSVFDPDRGGHEFAYTIGLHERGLPELHLWARPSLGEDPGLDWVFSVRDRTMVLNELAAKLVTGAIGIGSEIHEEYDSGQAIVRYRVDPPGDREELEAYGIAAAAEVLPVRWSLERAPEGDLVGLDPAACEVARRETVLLAATLKAGAASAPRGWAVPGLGKEIDFSPEQRYGPLTPLVRARAAQFWQADDDTLATMLELALVVELAADLTHPVSMAVAAARPVGRRRQLEVLSDDVRALVDRLVDRPAAQRRWRSIVEEAVPDTTGCPTSERRRLERSCAGTLHDLVRGCLLVDAVSDVVDHEVLLAARGPWVFATSDADRVENPDWWAPDEVLSIVESVLRPHDGPILGRICVAHQAAEQGESYARVVTRLTGWAVTSVAACPWDPVLSLLPAWDPFVASIQEQLGAGSDVDVKIAPLPPLQRWADCLTSALTHAERLTSDEISTFVAPVRDLLPELAPILERRAGRSAHDAA